MNIRLRDGTGSREYRYLIEDTDRHGNVRIYFRRKGKPKVRLVAMPGTAEFDAEYLRASSGQANPESAPSAVYVFGFDQYVKIGFSRNFQSRRKQLQEGLPRQLQTYLVLPGYTLTDEHALHRRFAKYRLRGEWFLFAGELADWVEEEVGVLSERRRNRRAENQPVSRLYEIARHNGNRWLDERAPGLPNPLDALL